MKKIRIIPRLDVKGDNVVKGIQMEGLRVLGKPEELARKYCLAGADEIIYMDIVASLYSRDNLLQIVERAAENEIFVPITVGGGIRSIEDINKTLRSGADKVAINTAAVKNPDLLRQAARIFGSSTIVLSLEAKKIGEGKWEAYTDNGREKTGLDAIAWAGKAVELGAGEVLVTSVDRDGTRQGFDLELINAITEAVPVPIVVSGGAGKIEHIRECMANQNVDGIALASLLHYNTIGLAELKEKLAEVDSARIRIGRGADFLKENSTYA